MKATMPSLLVLLALLVAVVGARGEEKEQLPAVARDVLGKVKQFELYSLEPTDEKPGEAGRLHGWKVLGKTTVKDAKTRKQLIDGLTKAIGKGKPAKVGPPVRHKVKGRPLRDSEIVEGLVTRFEPDAKDPKLGKLIVYVGQGEGAVDFSLEPRYAKGTKPLAAHFQLRPDPLAK